MKKTLVALVVTAFAASASATTVYDNDGTKVDFNGSLRLLLDHSKGKSKEKYDNGSGEKVRLPHRTAHTNLKDDGSRFGVNVKHNLADDFYALGRLEFRFNGNNKTADGFGDLYAKRAYVGLGSKQYGEVTFGRQLTIGDDIARAGFDNTYGVTETPLTTDGNSVVRYDYKGVEGLHVGVNYNFASEREDKTGDVKQGDTKAGYGAGAIYDLSLGEGQSASVAAGYTRDVYVTGTATKHHKDAWMAGADYTINGLTLAADYGGSFDKNGDVKKIQNGLQVGAKYQFLPEAAVYGNYAYIRTTNKTNDVVDSKVKHHKFMLGTEYKFHKQVKAFVEGRVVRAKVNGQPAKTTDKSVGVGLRVFW